MKTAIFSDLDSTIIVTKSGKSFAQHTDDWQLNTPIVEHIKTNLLRCQNKHLIIVSNQGGIQYGHVQENDFLQKSVNIIAALKAEYDIDATLFYAPAYDHNRKPAIGMAQQAEADGHLFSYDKNTLMYGDRPEDEGFANNCGFTYIDAKTL